MNISRRHLIQSVGGLPLAAAAVAGIPRLVAAAESTRAQAPAATGPIALPDKANFVFEGVHLNAAYTHPTGNRTRQALEAYIQARQRDPGRNWPVQNERDEAVQLFAGLINAQPTDVAVVPSTLEGENLVAAALDLGPTAGVVSDPFHYDASLVMYGELHKRGMPLTVIRPRGNRIDYADLDAAITPQTKLVAISWVASATGYKHDLKTVCDIAHKKGALVYADIIQGVGGIPLDVKACGVDFCCTGSYKWLMGEFGVAFLYVRPDRLAQLKRVQVGWRGMTAYKHHFMPFDPPGPAAGEYELGSDTAHLFEVSTPDWSGLAAMAGSLKYINEIGVARIARHREPMLRRLQEELPKHGFNQLTPPDCQGPSVVFSQEGMGPKFQRAITDAKIYVTLYKHQIRISPSVHNDMGDIERLIGILAA
jgi:selenocysteine lyase/cysteine desulfurase